ncbi:MAG: GPW/gp25 family protein [Pseudomonadota bacterium]
MAIARSEAVQPSLWDRFGNDLPGILTDIAALRAHLGELLGPDEDIDALIAAGKVGLSRRTDIDDATAELCHRLLEKLAERQRIENQGVVVTPALLREAVRRDIEVLFNIERLSADYLLTDTEAQLVETPEELLAEFPQVRRSVLNFGVPSFAGRKGSDFDRDVLAKELRDVLQIFEPRLKSDTIKVRVFFARKEGLKVEVDAMLLMSPVPERLRLSTTIDMDNGHAVTVDEAK